MAHPSSHPHHAQVLSHLTSKSLHPAPHWLASTLATQRANTPLPALKSTILFRLLASDITTSLQHAPANSFPADVLDASRQERVLRGPVVVQVLDVEDIGHSKWSQIERIEEGERGETTKGREVIRTVAGEVGDGDATLSASAGPFKLHLQDANGTRVYAIEIASVAGISLGMSIGAKIVLRDFKVARGVVLLEGAASAEMLGGKVGAWDKAWREGRKQRLLEAVGSG